MPSHSIGSGTLSFGLVSKLGGSIDCETVVGQGTEFIIRFPCVSEAPSAEADSFDGARSTVDTLAADFLANPLIERWEIDAL